MPAWQAAIFTPGISGMSGRCAGANGDGRTVDLAMGCSCLILARRPGFRLMYSKLVPLLKPAGAF
jgi:hypothetical protein